MKLILSLLHAAGYVALVAVVAWLLVNRSARRARGRWMWKTGGRS